jgi:(2Fe-2S) ferredoxin
MRRGPIIRIEPDGILYQGVTPEDAGDILDHLGGAPVERLLIDTEISFFKRQKKNAWRILVKSIRENRRL